MGVELGQVRIEMFDRLACERNDAHLVALPVHPERDVAPAFLDATARQVDQLLHARSGLVGEDHEESIATAQLGRCVRFCEQLFELFGFEELDSRRLRPLERPYRRHGEVEPRELDVLLAAEAQEGLDGGEPQVQRLRRQTALVPQPDQEIVDDVSR
jgi:hypothetical protein